MVQQTHFWVYIQRKRHNYVWRDICTPTVIEALVTIITGEKQPKCLQWMNGLKKYYTHIRSELLFSHEKKEISVTCLVNEVSQQRKTNSACYTFSVEFKKIRFVEKWLPGLGGESKGRLGKAYKISVLSWMRPRNLMYSMVTTVSNTVLYNWNLLRERT